MMHDRQGVIFGTEFVVQYWHAKHRCQSRECRPEHGVLSQFSAGLGFSAVNIAVS